MYIYIHIYSHPLSGVRPEGVTYYFIMLIISYIKNRPFNMTAIKYSLLISAEISD